MSTPKNKVVKLNTKAKAKPRPDLEGLERRIQIDIDDQPRTQIEQSLVALQKANSPKPFLFTRQSVVARLRQSPNDVRGTWLEELDRDGWNSELVDHADFVRETKQGWIPKWPPDALLRALHSRTEYPFPTIKRVVRAPFFTGDGALVADEGFHKDAQTYLTLTQDLRGMRQIPSMPTVDQVKQACEIIRYPIWQFPYKDKASYAHTVAIMLLPFVRPLLDGHLPIHAFTAPMERTGKGKLNNCACWPGLGHDIPVMPEVDNKNVEELRKRLTAIIIDGAPLVFFDNVNSVLRGGPLAAMLTARVWSDRILGKSKLVNAPVETSWIVAGNNLLFSKEIILRTLIIELDAMSAQPWAREFKEPQDPEGYIRQNRRELVWACLTLVRNWIALGRPLVRPPQVLGGFEQYASIMGSILAAAGIEGFMTNVGQIQESEDYDNEFYRAFLEKWWATQRDIPLGVIDICQIDNEFLQNPNENLRARATRFGTIMQRIKGRVYELRNEPADENDDRRYTVRIVPTKMHRSATGRYQIGGYQLELLSGEADKPRKRRR